MSNSPDRGRYHTQHRRNNDYEKEKERKRDRRKNKYRKSENRKHKSSNREINQGRDRGQDRGRDRRQVRGRDQRRHSESWSRSSDGSEGDEYRHQKKYKTSKQSSWDKKRSDGKSKACYNWINKGRCERGSECPFIHSERGNSYVHHQSHMDGSSQNKKNICLNFQEYGSCSHGDSCRYSHTNNVEQNRPIYEKRNTDDGHSTNHEHSNNHESPKPKEKPNFEASGKLAKAENNVNGVNLNYTQPPDARKPERRWRLYVFKGEKQLPNLPIHRESFYIIGRERRVAAIRVDHPSCSKQHAVVQFRQRIVGKEVEGAPILEIKPYLIDLNSTNGTYLNGKRIEAAKFYELMEKDLIKFGFSSRDYVLLHSDSLNESD